jgi:toxin FitB
MIVLDTNVVSETQRLLPDPKVIAWLDAQKPSSLYLTAISAGELMFGVHCLPPGARASKLSAAVNAILQTDFRGRVLPYDEAAALIYGEYVGAARRRGITIGQADGQIASVALANGATLIATRDCAPFEALGLAVVNPWG